MNQTMNPEQVQPTVEAVVDEVYGTALLSGKIPQDVRNDFALCRGLRNELVEAAMSVLLANGTIDAIRNRIVAHINERVQKLAFLWLLSDETPIRNALDRAYTAERKCKIRERIATALQATA